ncbi:MAG: Uma2 family endonuclease [Bryobacterales bacterium]|nr:Uma2 family endonuclease [Bryobacterales bacterium]
MLNSAVRIVVDTHTHCAYPDGSIVCEEARLDADGAVKNPAVLFEVYSTRTEAFDRGARFRSYQSMPSLREYFLISQNKPSVERFERVGEGKWTLSYHEGLDAKVPISSVPCELPFAEIYEHIVFETNQ